MDRVAVFIDAGYLFAQGSALLTGQKRLRGDLTLDAGKVVEAISTLAHMPGVKVRLGFVNRAGEQKGVDSLIVTDMISLARNHAMTDAVLLSGDEDLRVGVQQAQEFGVRVHLLGIKPSRGSQSLFLLQEADTTHEWVDDNIRAFLAHNPRKAPELAVPATLVAPHKELPADAPYAGFAVKLAATVDSGALESIVAGYKSSAQIPREFDAKLLAGARSLIGNDLVPKQKKDIRARFIAECERRLTGGEA